MTKEIGIALMVGLCILVLLIGIVKKKAELILNFTVRIVLGLAAIFFLNQFFLSQEIDIAVGINPISILTAGTLGTGGIALLYGIMAYRLL